MAGGVGGAGRLYGVLRKTPGASFVCSRRRSAAARQERAASRGGGPPGLLEIRHVLRAGSVLPEIRGMGAEERGGELWRPTWGGRASSTAAGGEGRRRRRDGRERVAREERERWEGMHLRVHRWRRDICPVEAVRQTPQCLSSLSLRLHLKP
jgi:hypothetical protein